MDRDEPLDADEGQVEASVRIESASISLRQIDCDGAQAILEHRCPPGRTWSSGYPTDGDLEAARHLLRRIREGERLGPFGTFEILTGSNDEVIGGIGFHRPPGPLGSVEVGYGIVPTYWNRGVCTEALQAIVEFAREHGARRVEARSLPSNGASRRVMEKAGLRFVEVVDGYSRYEISLI